jgi:bifunctional N-acetylglucosamine-1-phosphate-uridyltransferase/glucosamine-1-phosphate-acetyltransferase GlmU-like protein
LQSGYPGSWRVIPGSAPGTIRSGDGLQLIVLAAGSGTRFGGVKQLATVGPAGEAILDLLLTRAADAGFADAIVVTSPTIEEQMHVHLTEQPPSLPVEVVLQLAPRGTADAVLAARAAIRSRFAVVNADDLYPAAAFAMLLEPSNVGDSAVVAFQVGKTLIGTKPVKRAMLETDESGNLARITESTVSADDVRGDEWVSMNMWAFPLSMVDVFERSLHDAAASGVAGEVLLPDVVSALVDEGATVQVLRCDQACIGITYAEDVDVLRVALS